MFTSLLLFLFVFQTGCHRRPHYVVPILRERLSGSSRGPDYESSEEVRSLLVDILTDVATSARGDDFRPYAEDVVAILKEAIADSFPEVKVKSCVCLVQISEMSWLPPTSAPELVDSLLKCLTHQQRRVRVAAVKGLGKDTLAVVFFSVYIDSVPPAACMLPHCSSSCFQTSVPFLAQRLFDPAPEVRLNTASVAAKLLKEWTHR